MLTTFVAGMAFKQLQSVADNNLVAKGIQCKSIDKPGNSRLENTEVIRHLIINKRLYESKVNVNNCCYEIVKEKLIECEGNPITLPSQQSLFRFDMYFPK
jgi:hypothetical protein